MEAMAVTAMAIMAAEAMAVTAEDAADTDRFSFAAAAGS